MLTGDERARLVGWLGSGPGLVHSRQFLSERAKARGRAVRQVRTAARAWLEGGDRPTEAPPELVACPEAALLSALRSLPWDEHLMTDAATLL